MIDRIDPLFEEHRPRLLALAYRMLGSLSEADDALQETWLRLRRTSADEIQSPRAFLTTVTSRVCLNALRSRSARREEALPDPIVTPEGAHDPEQAAVLADGVGFALMVVLERLDPAE